MMHRNKVRTCIRVNGCRRACGNDAQGKDPEELGGEAALSLFHREAKGAGNVKASFDC